MRKFALLQSACAVLLFAGFARAQHMDVTVGAGTLVSSKYTTSSEAYLPPSEKTGLYPSVSVDRIFKNRFGFNAEVAFRAKQGLYNGYQGYRPVFYDVNGVFAPRLGKKTSADLMAGIGGETVLFYTQYANCSTLYPAGCTTNLTSNHLMGHLGGGVRYYFWHNFFVRPEAHLYLIHNDTQFSSAYVGRVAASVGYTFGPR